MKEVLQTERFAKWLRKLKDNLAKVAITRRIERLEQGNFGDSKSVGEKVFELRIDVGKGYRVYFMDRSSEIIILLVGGNKNTQSDDMKMEKLTRFDAAEYLDTDELQTLYLDEVAKENDPAALIKAIDTVARAKGMTKTAKEAGISREGLYKALSPNGNPSFATVCKILNAIGYTLVPERIAKKTEARL